MRLEVDSKELTRVLKAVKFWTWTRPTLPILESIIITASKEKTTVSVTDLQCWFETELEAKVITEGACLAPLKMLQQITTKADGVLILATKGKSGLTFKSEDATFKLEVRPVEDYPPRPEYKLSKKSACHVPLDVFQEAVDFVATATDGTTNTFTSFILFDFSGKTLSLIGTDGRRLHAVELLDSKRKAERWVVPVQLDTITKLRNGVSKPIWFTFFPGEEGAGTFVWRYGNSNGSVSCPGDINFPDWARVIPEKAEGSVLLDADKMHRCVQQIIPAASLREFVKIVIREGKKLKLIAENDDVRAEAEIDCTHTGADLEIGLNHDLLSDTLKLYKGAEVRMNYRKSLDSAEFVTTAEDTRQVILMPVRLEEK